MNQLTGEPLRGLPIGQLTFVRDLIHFDGPLLTQMRHPNGDQYLYHWCDSDDATNRWMVARVCETHIVRLVNRFVPLNYVIPNGLQDDFIYFVDVDGAGAVVQCVLQPASEIPANYLPAPGAYIPAGVARDDRSYSALIEGDLSLNMISEMPRRYSQAYAFLYTLRVLRPQGFRGHPWRGGFSSMHFFDALMDMLPGEQRPGVARLQYASPGFIRFSVHRPTAVELARCISMLSQGGEQTRLEAAKLSAYIRDNKLNEPTAEAGADWGTHNPQLINMTRMLFASIDIQETDALLAASRRPFEAAKIALAFVRRLTDLANLDREGLVLFPTE